MKTKRRGLCLILACILILAACSSGLPETKREPVPMGTGRAETPAATTEAASTAAYRDGIIGEGKPAGAGMTADGYYAEADMKAEAAAVPRTDAPCPPPGPAPAAGLLTAREWSDFRNIPEYLAFMARQEIQSLLAPRKQTAEGILSLTGLRGLDQLVLKNADGEILARAVSDVYGSAVLLFDREKVPPESALTLAVNGQETEVRPKAQLTELSFEEHAADICADRLDLMFMVDTTGSMGDELEYLKKELENVVEAVYRQNPGMSIRVSVNFYRDEGDEYVVKYYDFRDDIQAVVSLIEAQSAFGGGDYPEAVHTALDNAVFGHDWREDAVKLCYLVFDAPPHREGDMIRIDEQTRKPAEHIDDTLKKAVEGAAASGIRIIPVAASGADEEVEALGRSWAFMTGGTYIYLTNDSGIGYWHETPDVPETQLEYLNDCLIRVTCGYCGLKYEAEKYPEPAGPIDQIEPPVYEKPVEPNIRETE